MTYKELVAEYERLLKEVEAQRADIKAQQADIKFWRRQYDDAKKWYQSVTGKGAWE